MKKIIILFFAISFVSLNAQDEYDLLIKKLEITSQSQLMINQLVEYYTSQRTDIPKKTWKKITNEIDYLNFIKSIKELFKKSYTKQEINELIKIIDEYGIRAYKPKPKVTQEMYMLGKDFGKDIGNQINIKLKELGY